MKTCTKCDESFDLSMFYSSRSGKDGVGSWCKPCTKEHQRVYHAEWYKKNKQKKLTNAVVWAKSNPVKIKAHQTKHRHTHPEYDFNKKSRRRQRIDASCFVVSKNEILKMRQKPCIYCGEKSSHIDHVIPLSRGGQHRIGNLAPSCMKCNLTKNNKFISEWRFA